MLMTLPLKFRSLFRRSQVENELNDEMQFHIEQQIEAHMKNGLTREEARYAAVRAMHGVEQRKEECRDMRGVRWIEHAIHDLRYGIRILIKSPGFAFAVVATLALGIGATTAIFSVVYGVVMRPLPYPDSERLVTIGPVSTANYLDWRQQNTVFSDIGMIKLVQNFNITGDGEPERVLGGRSSASIFNVLGVQPILGRVFTEEEGRVEDKVVLSYGLWQRRYGSDRTIPGKTIQLNGMSYTVLGVMPPDFQYRNREFALWTPLVLNPKEPRTTFDYAAVARLKDGVTLAQAQAEMSGIQSTISKTYPGMEKLQLEISPMLDNMVGSVRARLYFLMGAVLCLLLIGTFNLANLLVARSMTRSQELVLRTALGAPRHRLILQSMMELLPPVALGGIFGILLAQWLLALLVPLLPSSMPRVEAIQLDWQVLIFAVVFLFVIGIATAIFPTLQVVRWNVGETLRESGRSIVSGGQAARLRSILVVGQISVVVVLMVSSALLIRSFVALNNVDPGFRSDNILSVHFALSEKYLTNPGFGRYLRGIHERVSAVPGVESVGLVNRLPLAGGNQQGTLAFENSPLPSGGVQLDWRTATPDYFRTMGIRLIEGRFFQESDTFEAPRVGIIDEKLAKLAWPNESAIGKRFRFPGQGPWTEVIGVVGHVRHDGLGIDQRPQVYWNYLQRAQPRMALAVRTSRDPGLLAASIVSAIHDIDPEQPVYDVRSMGDVVERSLSADWLNTALVSMFAFVSLVLASIGIYGVISYSVGLRSREIGIRMALGSQRGEVIRMILSHGGLLAGIGTLIGLAGSLFLGRVLSSLLFGVRPTDALSFFAASLLLLVVTLAASYIPARRAASVDPSSVLRIE